MTVELVLSWGLVYCGLLVLAAFVGRLLRRCSEGLDDA